MTQKLINNLLLKQNKLYSSKKTLNEHYYIYKLESYNIYVRK